jgi:hypothetical protein
MFRPATHRLNDELTIRRLDARDAAALSRVAERDSARAPEGTVYAAVAGDGSILAAISLETRALVADPFVPSAHAAALLRVWTGRLDGIHGSRRARRGVRLATPETAPSTAPC